MMDQYFRLKEQAGDAIVFFRCGDFYETFMDDAITASRVLDITLTKRGFSKGKPVPLAGVPHHAVNNYIYKLTRAGYRVAICEQMEGPGKGKKVLKRELVRTVTPGTIIDSDVVAGTDNNYLAAIFEGGIDGWGLAYVDITTGEFHATAETGNSGWAAILSELAKLSPSELLVDRRVAEDENFLKPLRQNCSAFVTPRHFQEFNPDLLKSQGIKIDTSGCHRISSTDRKLCLTTAGAIISYLGETQKQTLSQLASLSVYQRKRFVQVDRSTERNLELLASQGQGGVGLAAVVSRRDGGAGLGHRAAVQAQLVAGVDATSGVDEQGGLRRGDPDGAVGVVPPQPGPGRGGLGQQHGHAPLPCHRLQLALPVQPGRAAAE